MLTTIKIKMYYDIYEEKFGDGFYPLSFNESGTLTQIDILFTEFQMLNGEIVWKQDNKINPIMGLDGSTGIDLLGLLNKYSSKNHTKIFASNNVTIYPKIYKKY